MGVDLTVARQAAEWLMTSACTLTRDTEGVADDALDPVTLKLTRPPGEPAILYAGACVVRQVEPRAGENEATGEDRERPGFQVDLPWTAPTPERWDVVTITACDDASLVGVSLRVEEVHRTQWLVRRQLLTVRT